MGITRLGPQFARASEKLGVSLELVTGVGDCRTGFEEREPSPLRAP